MFITEILLYLHLLTYLGYLGKVYPLHLLIAVTDSNWVILNMEIFEAW